MTRRSQGSLVCDLASLMMSLAIRVGTCHGQRGSLDFALHRKLLGATRSRSKVAEAATFDMPLLPSEIDALRQVGGFSLVRSGCFGVH